MKNNRVTKNHKYAHSSSILREYEMKAKYFQM